jgi:hypothetical protein
MSTRFIAVGLLAFAATLTAATQSHAAVSLAECGTNYKTAKTAGTLNGMKWAAYKKSECGIEARAPAHAAKTPDATGPVTSFSSPWGAPTVGARPN